MKKITLIMLLAFAAVCTVSCSSGQKSKAEGKPQSSAESSKPDEGEAAALKTEKWKSGKDNSEHTATIYSLGNTAEEIKKELSGEIKLSHKFIDNVPVYEMYREDRQNAPVVLFMHGQLSRKEENLGDMTAFADAGYFCVALDLQGHGERVTDEPLMALEITKNTSSDIDLLLDYYSLCKAADSNKFALIGFSQGGSTAYWYSAYGESTPSALIVGSTSPDFNYPRDNTCISGGELTKQTWSDSKIKEFVNKYNPINHWEKLLKTPVLSGNSLDDEIVSYKGSEALEKKLSKGGNKDISFFYFDGAGHNITKEFLDKMLPFVQKHL